MKFNIEFDGPNAVSVTAFADKPYVADSNHPNFSNIIGALQGGVIMEQGQPKRIVDEDIVRLFDTSLALTDTFVSLSERVTQNGGHIYFDGVELKNGLVDRILSFLRDGLDFGPLVLFLENLGNNPSVTSQANLYEYLEKHRFSITTDGHFIAYKSVSKDTYLSSNSGKAQVDGKVINGKIPNKPGSVIIMPRNEVIDNPNNGCAQGLHAATWNFARGFMSSGAMLMLKINPRDVVSIPRDGHTEKMRVCRYVVIKEVTTEDKSDLIDLGDVKKTAEFGPDKAPEVQESALLKPGESVADAVKRTSKTKTAKASVKANKASKAKKVAKSKTKAAPLNSNVVLYKAWKRENFDALSLKEFRSVAKEFGVPNSAKITAAARKGHTDRFVRRMRDHRRK